MLLQLTSTGQVAQALTKGDVTFVHKTTETETSYTTKEISALPFAAVFGWYQKSELFLNVSRSVPS